MYIVDEILFAFDFWEMRNTSILETINDSILNNEIVAAMTVSAAQDVTRLSPSAAF
jgi:hypothetical protein